MKLKNMCLVMSSMNKKNLLLLAVSASVIIILLVGMSCNVAAATNSETTYAQEVTSGPLGDARWVNSTDSNLDLTLLDKKIVAYRIQWFNGSWSSWYVPGVNDLYKKAGEPTRRIWANFNDHNFTYIAVPAAYATSLRTYAEFNKGVTTANLQPSGTGFYTFGSSYDSRWVNSLDINIDKTIDKKKIVAYKLTWSSGTKSGWFIPGYSDIYQKPGEPQKRWWACFNDHSHEYIAFPVD